MNDSLPSFVPSPCALIPMRRLPVVVAGRDKASITLWTVWLEIKLNTIVTYSPGFTPFGAFVASAEKPAVVSKPNSFGAGRSDGSAPCVKLTPGPLMMLEIQSSVPSSK